MSSLQNNIELLKAARNREVTKLNLKGYDNVSLTKTADHKYQIVFDNVTLNHYAAAFFGEI